MMEMLMGGDPTRVRRRLVITITMIYLYVPVRCYSAGTCSAEATVYSHCIIAGVGGASEEAIDEDQANRRQKQG